LDRIFSPKEEICGKSSESGVYTARVSEPLKKDVDLVVKRYKEAREIAKNA
jgi:hypothetical protein